MWLMLPEGMEGVSVERQYYPCELRSASGRGLLRVPDHFAPRLLDIPGFAIADDLPEGAPEDLPKADPLRDGAIETLTRENEALKTEVANANGDLMAVRAQLRAIEYERNDLADKLRLKTALADRLAEELEDKK